MTLSLQLARKGKDQFFNVTSEIKLSQIPKSQSFQLLLFLQETGIMKIFLIKKT